VVVGKTKIDEDFLDELESILIQADVGVATTLKIIDALEDRTKKEKYLGFKRFDKNAKGRNFWFTDSKRD